MFLETTNAAEVYNVIMSASRKASTCIDGVSYNILGHAVKFIVYPLNQLVKLSFLHGTFPSRLKWLTLV